VLACTQTNYMFGYFFLLLVELLVQSFIYTAYSFV